VLVADYAKDYTHANIAGRDLLIEDPKKPVSQIVFVGRDYDTSKTHIASKKISVFRARYAVHARCVLHSQLFPGLCSHYIV
jgi:hypothetical protein